MCFLRFLEIYQHEQCKDEPLEECDENLIQEEWNRSEDREFQKLSAQKGDDRDQNNPREDISEESEREREDTGKLGDDMEPPEEHIPDLRTDMRSSEIAEVSAEVKPGSLGPGMIELCESDREERENQSGREIGSDRSKIVDGSRNERSDDFERESEDIGKDDEYRYSRDDEEILASEFFVIENGVESRTHESDEFLKEEPKPPESVQSNRPIHEEDHYKEHRHEYPHRKERSRDKTENRLSFEGRNMRSSVDFGSGGGCFGRGHESRKRLKSR